LITTPIPPSLLPTKTKSSNTQTEATKVGTKHKHSVLFRYQADVWRTRVVEHDLIVSQWLGEADGWLTGGAAADQQGSERLTFRKICHLIGNARTTQVL